MTNQELFNYLAAHLLIQGRHSSSDKKEFFPALYGKNGDKCPIGALLPPSKYRKEFETVELGEAEYPHADQHDLAVELVTALGLTSSTQIFLVSKIQELHNGSNPRDWWKGLQAIAKRFDLSPSVLESFPAVALQEPTAV